MGLPQPWAVEPDLEGSVCVRACVYVCMYACVRAHVHICVFQGGEEGLMRETPTREYFSCILLV